MQPSRLIIGISGASGAAYGIALLKILRELSIKTDLIISKSARLTIASETDYSVQDIQNLADQYYSPSDISACMASGSYKNDGMIIAPCSIRTMSEVATGVTSTLLSRAADVTLKEKRKLVLMVRETPLHAGHLESLLKLAQIGAIIAPPVPALYTRPDTIDALITQTVCRVLDLFSVDTRQIVRWQGLNTVK